MGSSVLLVSGGLSHPSWRIRRALRLCLSASDTETRRVPSVENLLLLDPVRFQAMILCYHSTAVSPAALARLEGFVRDGGGILAVHAALASYKNEDRYAELLGSRLRGHGPIGRFTVEPAGSPNAPFDVEVPFPVVDELYRNDYSPGNNVRFVADSPDGPEPVVWTRAYGKGRVCCVSLGHRAATLRHPSMARILKKGFRWACGGGPQ